MQHSGMDMSSVVASETVAVSTLTNATLLPRATDSECGTVLLESGGTWSGHVGHGLVFVLWGLWWTVNMFLANFRQSAVGNMYCSSSYHPSPWRHARSIRCFKHWRQLRWPGDRFSRSGSNWGVITRHTRERLSACRLCALFCPAECRAIERTCAISPTDESNSSRCC